MRMQANHGPTKRPVGGSTTCSTATPCGPESRSALKEAARAELANLATWAAQFRRLTYIEVGVWSKSNADRRGRHRKRARDDVVGRQQVDQQGEPRR